MIDAPVFKLGRTLILSFISLLALVWMILLSVVAFAWWDILAQPERSFMGLLMGVNAITVVGLPVLLLTNFRPWLDGARISLLAIAHVGAAIGFALWVPRFACSTEAGAMSTCIAINDYILAFSWVVPTLLVLYALCLAIFSWRNRRSDAPIPERKQLEENCDVEKAPVHPEPATPIFAQRATVDFNPEVRPEWQPLPRNSMGPARVTIQARNSVPRLTLPPLPPHMSWSTPPQNWSTPSSPGIYSLYATQSPGNTSPITPHARKSFLPPHTPTRLVPVNTYNLTDRMSRLSELVAERTPSDTISEDSTSIGVKESKRKLVKSFARGQL